MLFLFLTHIASFMLIRFYYYPIHELVVYNFKFWKKKVIIQFMDKIISDNIFLDRLIVGEEETTNMEHHKRYNYH